METKTIETTVKLSTGKSVTSEIEIEYCIENYGMDADGNRGMPCTFINHILVANAEFADDDSVLSDDESAEAEELLKSAAERFV